MFEPLRVTRYTFGEIVSLGRRKSGGAAYSLHGKNYLFGDTRIEVKPDELESTYFSEPERGPYERADFGDCERLAWANGACSMETDATLVWWGKRFAAWFEGAWLHLVDVTRSTTVRLALPIEIDKVDKSLAHEGSLYLASHREVAVFPLADLEALFDQASGQRIVHVREHYPLRRPEAKQAMVVSWAFDGYLSLDHDNGGWSRIRIPLVEENLDRGDRLTLHDMLATDQYLEYSIGGGPRKPLYEHDFPAEHGGSCELVVEPAVDPAGTLRRASQAVRTEELDRLFGVLADEPDDDASRMVVVDLLEEAGEPYAPLFAKLLAGDETVRAESLGTLTNYLDNVEWHGNLPRAATLSETAPLDEDIGNLVMADHRLGFFHSLRLGAGNFKLYAKLVAAPRAVGLRHVDGSRAQTLKALIAAGRKELRRLSGVKFVSREVIEALADPTFDRAYEVETEVQASSVARLLDYVTRDEAKFFARAPRHLELVEKAGEDDLLVTAVLEAWALLPVDKLSFAGATLTRARVAIVQPHASTALRGILAGKFRVEEA